MDLEQIVSYGELRDALPGTGKGRVPRLNQLKKMARVVLHRKTASGVIEIYSNGFFSFEECGRVIVYGVDRCERPETYTCNGKKEAGMEKLDLGEYPWRGWTLTPRTAICIRKICRRTFLRQRTILLSACRRNTSGGRRKRQKQIEKKRCLGQCGKH